MFTRKSTLFHTFRNRSQICGRRPRRSSPFCPCTKCTKIFTPALLLRRLFAKHTTLSDTFCKGSLAFKVPSRWSQELASFVQIRGGRPGEHRSPTFFSMHKVHKDFSWSWARAMPPTSTSSLFVRHKSDKIRHFPTLFPFFGFAPSVFGFLPVVVPGIKTVHKVHSAPSPQALSFQPSAFSPETGVLSAFIGVHRRPLWFFAQIVAPRKEVEG